MSIESINRTLELLGENPHQSYAQIREKLINEKLMFAGRKGPNSEKIVAFVVGQIPKILSVKPFHDFLGDLDADLICEVENIEPIFIQVKTSQVDCVKFRQKIERRRRKGLNHRIVSLSFEVPFDQIIEEFVCQVNSLEGRNILKPVKF